MRIYIGSDIHGSSVNASKFFDVVDSYANEHDDTKVVLLGDIYNHGPRNPFPEGYAPMSVASLLNAHKQNLFVVKGNCDSEVDQMISEFEFVNDVNLLFGKHNVLFTHGHKCSVNMPKMNGRSGDIVFYGHFHRMNVERKNDVLYVCVGALGLSPQGVEKSYAILEENTLEIRALDDNKLLFACNLD